MPRPSFAEHDRVEEIAGALNAHHASAALIEIVNLTPDLQALGLQLNRQTRALQVSTIENHQTVLEFNFAVWGQIERAEGLFQVAVKFPGRERLQVDRLLCAK